MSHMWYEQIFGAPEPAYTRGRAYVPRTGSPESIAAALEKATAQRALSMQEGRDMFTLDTSDPQNHRLMSKANSKWFNVGRLTTPDLAMLREEVTLRGQRCAQPPPPTRKGQMSASLGGIYIVHEAVSDVLPLHSQYPQATFQAASQMNCLEFPNQHTVPEDGVTIYSADPTQGPACALACAAGSVYRNYFCPRELLFDSRKVDAAPPLQGARSSLEADACEATADAQAASEAEDMFPGQSTTLQVNNLAGIHHALDNSSRSYWRVENGYTLSSPERLKDLSLELEGSTSRGSAARGVADLDGLTSLIRVGVHKNVGVDFSSRWTVPERPCTVQQVYCSACSCSYSGMSNQLWEKFARMVLHANYEATLLAAAGHEGGSGHVFLTFIGGGVFRNDMAWIVDAIARAVWNVSKMGNVQLQVHVCHYREVNVEVAKAINSSVQRLQRATHSSGKKACSIS